MSTNDENFGLFTTTISLVLLVFLVPLVSLVPLSDLFSKPYLGVEIAIAPVRKNTLTLTRELC